jgi:DNA-directed RNA polymerase delta subunit
MSKLNPSKLVSEVINALNPRLKEVISKRYGLKDGRRYTLEAIGKQFGITRERVRQIEAEAFRQLRQPEVLSKLEPIFGLFKNHINAHGRLRKEVTFLEYDLENSLGIAATPDQKAAANFILTLTDSFKKVPETKYFHTLWTTELEAVKSLPKFVSAIEDYLKKKNGVVEYAEFKSTANEALKNHIGLSPTPKVTQAYLGAVRNVGRNVFGQFGLGHWPEISPRGVKDKAYLVLKKRDKPMHFKDVAGSISQAGFSNRKAHIQTVHNELIKDKRFVLVGRGTYALKEWGYQPGTVKDVLVGILKENGRPMSKEEIVNSILKQRQVKENTIILNLQNKDYFSKNTEGRYTLKA